MSSEDPIEETGGPTTENTSKFQRFQDMGRKVPLIGPLVDCRLDDHGDTVKQVFVTFILATAPYWLGALVLYVTIAGKDPITFRHAFYSTVWDGELFMTATGLLAPIFWIIAEDPRGAGAFPSRLAHVLVTVLLSAVASVFFGLGIVNRGLREPFTFHLSVLLFIVAVSLLYLSTVYNLRRLPNSAITYREGETEFAEAYERHRA